MTTTRHELLTALSEATDRFTATIEALEDVGLAEPSRLDGWTRGHVAAHVARSSQVLAQVLESAASGAPVRGYASPEAREREIEDGAGRPAAEQIADVRATLARFLTAAAVLDEEQWQATVELGGRPGFLVADLPAGRLAEVELHHVDLGAGYTARDWPEPFASGPLPAPWAAWRDERRSWAD